MIVGVLVVRSVRRRRQRNTAFAAALASGSYGPLAALRGKQGAESQPVLWETLITSVYDPGKRWAGLLVRLFYTHSLLGYYWYPHAEGVCHGQPVAGVGMMTVPVHETSQHPASRQPRRRFPALGTRRPVAPDLLQTAPSLESSALSSGSMHLTVLVTMPTPLAHGKVRQGRGPPVVELGIAEVTYMPTVS